MDKSVLRRECRRQRDQMGEAEAAAYSSEICRLLTAHPAVRQCRIVRLFASIGREPDLEELFHWCIAQGKEVSYPKVQGRDMMFYKVHSQRELHPGAMGIREPETERPDLEKEAVMILPGLAFDRFGGRIGYGGGYYDRFLAAHDRSSLYRIGAAYDFQILDERLPQEETDIPVQEIAVPSGVIVCKKGESI